VLIFIAIVLSMIMHSMMYGPQAALIGESFPTRLRYGGAGLGYQLASVFASGPAPLVATWLLHETGTAYSISVYIVVAAVITVVCCLALPDRSRVNIDDATGLQPRLNTGTLSSLSSLSRHQCRRQPRSESSALTMPR
jgi:MFS family permease